MIEGIQFDELVADIKAHGQREPIVLFQGKVIDGRNRYRACVAAGVYPVCVPLAEIAPDNGADPIAFVVSRNLRRRHLDESQRAMIAEKLVNMRQGERTDLPSAGLRKVDQSTAADLLNVSRRSVQSAKVVRRKGTKALARAVEKGSLSVSLAEKATQLEQAKQDEVAALASHGNSKAARKAIADEVDHREPIVEDEAARKVIPDAPSDRCAGALIVGNRSAKPDDLPFDVGFLDLSASLALAAAKRVDVHVPTIKEWGGDWPQIKAVREVAAAWQGLALRMEEAMPPKGEPREWRVLDITIASAAAIETGLEALGKILKRKPSAFGKPDASRLDSKRILAQLKAELTACGAIPAKQRKAAKATAGEQHAGEQIDLFEAPNSKAAGEKLEADNMARQLICMGDQEMPGRELNRGHRTQTLEEGA